MVSSRTAEPLEQGSAVWRVPVVPVRISGADELAPQPSCVRHSSLSWGTEEV